MEPVLATVLIGAGIFSMLLGLVRTPAQMVAVALLVGIFGGVSTPAIALAATQTPPELAGTALGWVYAGSSGRWG